MNQQRAYIPAGHTPSIFLRSRSITTTVVGGIFVTGLLFAAFSIIALLGLLDLRQEPAPIFQQQFRNGNDYFLTPDSTKHSTGSARTTFPENLFNKSEGQADGDFSGIMTTHSLYSSSLPDRLDRLIYTSTVLFLTSLLLGLALFFYFRHVLLSRLLRLNRTLNL